MHSRRKLLTRRLVIASHNQGKIKEIEALLAPFGIETTSSSKLKLLEPDETGDTYLENALIKARACTASTGLPALGDDSGIEVSALDGQPGLHTAPYTKKLGGREAVFALWEAMPAIKNNPAARFVCIQVLCWPDGHFEYFAGVVNGKLSFPPRGSGGHGYDPVFIPQGHNRTIAEMSFNEKNQCSHRFIALAQLINACVKNTD